MKKLLTLLALMGMIAASAQAANSWSGTPGSVGGTLYQQEGSSADGPAGINAYGKGPNGAAGMTGSDNWTNWKYQYGGGSETDIYAGSNGALVASTSGDMNVDIEADIEMYIAQTIANNKVYFHLGNIYNATDADKTALITGTLKSNNGQYVGISFDGTDKTAASFEKTSTGYTGKIIGGMVSDRDTWRTQNNTMDLQILMSDGINGYMTPVNFGDGSNNTIHKTLWWLVNNGAAGTYNLTWQVKLLPVADQPDGDYHMDPVVVSAPVL